MISMHHHDDACRMPHVHDKKLQGPYVTMLLASIVLQAPPHIVVGMHCMACKVRLSASILGQQLEGWQEARGLAEQARYEVSLRVHLSLR